MQRVDLLVNGRLVNVNQRSDNAYLLNRIKRLIQTEQAVLIRRHPDAPPTPPPVPTPTRNELTARAQNVLFTAWNPQTALAAPVRFCIALTADVHVECSDDDDESTRERKAAAYVEKAKATAKAQRDRGGRVAVWGVQTQIPQEFIRSFAATLEADYIIWQAETSEEYRTAILAGAGVIVGNSNAWTPEQRQDAIKRISAGSLAFIFETYTNDGAPWPKDSTSSGVPPASFCIGVYNSKWHPSVADYKANTKPEAWPGISIYHAAAVEDWASL